MGRRPKDDPSEKFDVKLREVVEPALQVATLAITDMMAHSWRSALDRHTRSHLKRSLKAEAQPAARADVKMPYAARQGVAASYDHS